jgi:hypothetical protein
MMENRLHPAFPASADVNAVVTGLGWRQVMLMVPGGRKSAVRSSLLRVRRREEKSDCSASTKTARR